MCYPPTGYIIFSLKKLKFYGGRVIQTPFSNICTLYYLKVECMEIDWLCKHEKGQNQPSFYVSIFLHWII